MGFQEINKKYGRALLVIVSVFIWAFVIYSLFVNGYLNTWYKWHIPAKEPPFIDFRLIPSGAETFREGIDPAISNPNDPKHHIFNYPKIWYLLFYTGITQADTIWLCILLITLFFLIVFIFPEKLYLTDALLTLFIVFSPAAMLLYERGNVDIIFFILCGISVLLLAYSPKWTVFVLSLAAIFKFFPLFGIGIFLQENRNRFYKYFFVSLFIFLIYVVISFDSLTVAWKLTQRGTVISYGVYVFFTLLEPYFRYYLLKVISEDYILTSLKWLPYAVAGSFLTVVFFLGVKRKIPFPIESERNLVAFRMGTLIYIGTFLLGNNWDYRLAFLIFTVPQLSRWIFSTSGTQKGVVIGTFLSLVLSCWFMFLNRYIMQASDYAYEFHMKIFDEIMNWLLFGGLTYLFVASAPEWFRKLKWFSPLNPI